MTSALMAFAIVAVIAAAVIALVILLAWLRARAARILDDDHARHD